MASASPSETPPRLELIGVSKRFPGCLANDDIFLTIAPGEIHALLGENGAGKSTLVKYVYGVQKADSGHMRWEGRECHPDSPQRARAMGIGMVFQHFSLFEAMTVRENIALALPAEEAGTGSGLRKRIVSVSESYGLPLDPDRYVHSLSAGERQRIEIVRCLLQNPKLLIMDEPTSVLTPQEADRLFETLRRLSTEGVSILYISHRLAEIRSLCHRATILRNGRVVDHCDPRQETARTLAEKMMGESAAVARERAAVQLTAERLSLTCSHLESDEPHGTDLKDVSLSVRGGEILGIAGIAGNGQAELMAVISGERKMDDAKAILIDGTAAGHMGPRHRRRLGLFYVPEERLGHGTVPDMPLWENALLSARGSGMVGLGGFIRRSTAKSFAGSVVDRFRVKTAGIGHAATSLSGGNLQKFIIGREIHQTPNVLVAMQPTWGVDAGSALAIRQALLDLASGGAAVVVVTQDLDELLEISTRVSVMCEGKLIDAGPVDTVSVEHVGLLMGGLHGNISDAEVLSV
ncbi:ABC transporter ATP-binding protein [Magnetospira sp. QH-2]|uniref:ABC transporter ATP-binding protein n=1 Tax=Magnetospira sp. (strain QH-2) TaxID=1288970 RepID=UPI0003E80AA3|nr:ABC transporter ATP-binding protein [Magnetospira sp. QH-2]CCQ74702.1 putative ABC transporter, ATP-binding protein [Magnetospira sp. QH-2]